jgi:hypothetical protein
VAIHVISTKSGIPKNWKETLLILLLGIDIDIDCKGCGREGGGFKISSAG